MTPSLPLPTAETPPRTVADPFADLVRRHQRGVWRFLRMLGCPAADADALAVETFATAHEKGLVERDPREAAAFLRRTARFLWLRHARVRERSPWFAAACLAVGIAVVGAVRFEAGHGQNVGSGRASTAAHRSAVAPLPGVGGARAQDPQPEWLTVEDAAGLATVPAACTALRCWPRSADDVAALARLETLARLDLGLAEAQGEQPPLDSAMLRGVAKLASLRELRLDYRTELEPAWLQALESLPLLEAISLRCVAVDDAAAQRLARLPSLRRIDLAFDAALGDAGLAALAAMPQLRELSLQSCSGVTGEGLRVLGRARALTSLDLTFAAGPQTTALRGGPATGAFRRRLETMQMMELMAASAKAPATGVDDAVLAALAELGKLRSLRLTGCTAITADGLGRLRELPLRELHLTVVGPLTAHVAALPPTLETLGIAHCSGTTDADLEAIARQVPHLQRLDLTRCTAVTSAGLKALLDRCVLRELVLTTCAGMDGEALPTLLAHRSLERLDVTGLRWVDAEAERQLRELPALRTLENRKGGVMIKK